jgi:hypothetical protein
LSFSLLVDKSLQRGDLKIKSGSIEVSEIIDDKIKLSQSNTIKKELNNLQDKSNTLTKEEGKDLKRNSDETLPQKKEEHDNS